MTNCKNNYKWCKLKPNIKNDHLINNKNRNNWNLIIIVLVIIPIKTNLRANSKLLWIPIEYKTVIEILLSKWLIKIQNKKIIMSNHIWIGNRLILPRN